MCYVMHWMLLVLRQTEVVGGRWFGLLGFAFHPVLSLLLFLAATLLLLL